MSNVIEQTRSPAEPADGLRRANKLGADAATASATKEALEEPQRHDAVDAEQDAFDSMLRLLMGLRNSDTLGEDFARQVVRANRRAQANQRLTEHDLRVADAEVRRRCFAAIVSLSSFASGSLRSLGVENKFCAVANRISRETL